MPRKRAAPIERTVPIARACELRTPFDDDDTPACDKPPEYRVSPIGACCARHAKLIVQRWKHLSGHTPTVTDMRGDLVDPTPWITESAP